MSDVIIDSRDKKYFIERPDATFSPARNKAVILETIQATDAYFKSLEDSHRGEIEDRMDILVSYAGHLDRSGTKKLKDYVGKELYSRLIGEKILSKYRALSSVDKLQGSKVLL